MKRINKVGLIMALSVPILIFILPTALFWLAFSALEREVKISVYNGSINESVIRKDEDELQWEKYREFTSEKVYKQIVAAKKNKVEHDFVEKKVYTIHFERHGENKINECYKLIEAENNDFYLEDKDGKTYKIKKDKLLKKMMGHEIIKPSEVRKILKIHKEELLNEYEIINYSETHGGFLGDGHSYFKLKVNDEILEENIRISWTKELQTQVLSRFYKTEKSDDVMYYFKNENENTTHLMNFTYAEYDFINKTLIIYVYDS